MRTSNPFHALFAHRTQKDWGRRIGLLVVAGLLGYWAIASSLAHTLVRIDPMRAHALMPSNGVIAAAYAQNEFTIRPSLEDDGEIANLARVALRSEPTAVEALSVLGFQAQLREEFQPSNRIFAYSDRLSRRQLRSRIWAIEQAVDRGDIQGALAQYDIALTTSSSAESMLFPVLGQAIAEPRVRSRLLKLLQDKPEWGASFVEYVARSGKNPVATMQFFREGQKTGLKVSEPAAANLINALVASGEVEPAWDYYKSLRPTARRSASRDPNFASSDPARTAFDWRPASDPAISASILQDGQSGVLDFAVPSSTRGIAASQMQLLPRGRYALRGQVKLLETAEGAQPYWSVTCADGRELARADVPSTVSGPAEFGTRFSVPQGCPTQELVLNIRSTDDIGGVAGQISSASISRIGNADGMEP